METLHADPHLKLDAGRDSKSLAIALVVSGVFLLAAVGVALWMVNKPGESLSVGGASSGDGSNLVKNVSWVAPGNLSASYAKRQQDTQTVKTTYYFDAASDCGITTVVQPMTANSKPKDVVVNAAKAAQSYGITTSTTTDATDVKIKDAAGQPTYTFPAVQLEQNVNVPGIPFNAQRNIIAYKQFGSQVASIGYSCKTSIWDSKKSELATFVAAFTVKTQK